MNIKIDQFNTNIDTNDVNIEIFIRALLNSTGMNPAELKEILLLIGYLKTNGFDVLKILSDILYPFIHIQITAIKMLNADFIINNNFFIELIR